ncbi:hypothetical protein [Nonomuraea sp. bgisy101]|uniref:hypothetical protein n=1 Tax=Nonomuraea sp. bgisy101 TaxID=3413784 RepID=UPI003D730EDE
MEAVLAGLVAIAGTLLGSFVTYVFQQRAAKRAEQFTLSARLREERMTVYSGFAGAVLEFRSAQYNRTLLDFRSKGSPEYEEAKASAYQLRAVAWHSLYRVHLLSEDPEIARLADAAMSLAADMQNAEDRTALTQQGDTVRRAVEAFVLAASAEVKTARPVAQVGGRSNVMPPTDSSLPTPR